MKIFGLKTETRKWLKENEWGFLPPKKRKEMELYSWLYRYGTIFGTIDIIKDLIKRKLKK